MLTNTKEIKNDWFSRHYPSFIRDYASAKLDISKLLKTDMRLSYWSTLFASISTGLFINIQSSALATPKYWPILWLLLSTLSFIIFIIMIIRASNRKKFIHRLVLEFSKFPNYIDASKNEIIHNYENPILQPSFSGIIRRQINKVPIIGRLLYADLETISLARVLDTDLSEIKHPIANEIISITENEKSNTTETGQVAYRKIKRSISIEEFKKLCEDWLSDGVSKPILTTKQKNILTCLIISVSPEVLSAKRKDRPDLIFAKLKEQNGDHGITVRQIDNYILKNTHTSFERIFRRLQEKWSTEKKMSA